MWHPDTPIIVIPINSKRPKDFIKYYTIKEHHVLIQCGRCQLKRSDTWIANECITEFDHKICKQFNLDNGIRPFSPITVVETYDQIIKGLADCYDLYRM